MAPAAAPPEPWRSGRKRKKSRAAMEAEEDAAAEAELGMSPRKRRRGAAGKGGGTRRRRAAMVEVPDVRQPVGVAAAGVMEVDDAAGKVGTVCRRMAKGEKLKEVGVEEAPGTMDAHDAARTAIGDDDDVCAVAEEPDPEVMRMDEAAALQAEEQAMGGARAGSAGARNWVGQVTTETYRAKDPASSHATRSESDGGMTETRAECHCRAACVDGAGFDLGDDKHIKALIPTAAPPELWCSSRKRKKSRTAKEAEEDAAEAEAEMKRRRGAAGNAGTARQRAAKVEAPEVKQPVGVGEMEVNDALDAAGREIGDRDDMCAEEPDPEVMRMDEEEEEAAALEAEEEQAMGGASSAGVRKRVAGLSTERTAVDGAVSEDYFVGEPVPEDEARRLWPDRYRAKDSASTHARRPKVQEELRVRCHYRAACVDGANFDLGDDVYIKAAPGEENYLGRITEFFQGMDHGSYFTCRWFYRVSDTVISRELMLKVHDHKHDPKRVFLSDHQDDNLLNSIISKVNIIDVAPNTTPQAKAQIISTSDFYYDMSYSVAYSTFGNMPSENVDATGSEAASDISCDDVDFSKVNPIADLAPPPVAQMETATLLDLYSGCGAMSTGLCLGAALSGIKLNTKWAVDMNTYACNSLKYNHPDTKVRNEKAEDFLSLLQQWDALCKKYGIQNSNSVDSNLAQTSNDDEYDENKPLPEGTFEVEGLVDICYGDLNNSGKGCLWFKVRWKRYDPSQDTWEPLDGLSNSPECIKEFVESGYKESILPLPGCVDVICGGPPCQGISGLNRFRNPKDPLKDERNQQLVVFMDIVNFLRPKYVLMENVVDILKFANGFLGRYALSRLVSMSYQARLGMMVAGCYGLPQFRMRAFLWGALPSVVLPKFPLPTHGVVNRGLVPKAFSHCVVAYREDENKLLKKALVIRDAISDLPKVENYQPKDVMKYQVIPTTEFQRYIHLNRKDMMDYSFRVDSTLEEIQLFDHQPLQLNPDDYERVQKIPLKKGANFRDLEGVQVGENNTVEFVPDKLRVLLSSGKPLVPSYAMSYCKGKSLKPFGRLWWDETVPTVVTRAEPHTQIILHPSQHRVLTVRENARLQGFPDYYRLFGPVIEKYIQVGNAVAVPVARALGYSFGQAYQGEFSGRPAPVRITWVFYSCGSSNSFKIGYWKFGTSVGEVVQAEYFFDRLG